MSNRPKIITPRSALWRLVVSAVLATASGIVVINVLRQPVAGETRSYAAEFTDASDVQVGTDVPLDGPARAAMDGVEGVFETGH
jgi:phospholipid/cholesterol/gamma-HCH transport system substrate-binding protein